jgi:hypothetical protein
MLRKSRWRSLASTALGMFSAFLDQKEKSRTYKGNGTKNGRKGRPDKNGNGKKLGIPKDFFDDYAMADGWDPEKYVKIVNAAKAAGSGNGSGGKGGGNGGGAAGSGGNGGGNGGGANGKGGNGSQGGG